jgi:hypothetical protein
MAQENQTPGGIGAEKTQFQLYTESCRDIADRIKAGLNGLESSEHPDADLQAIQGSVQILSETIESTRRQINN